MYSCEWHCFVPSVASYRREIYISLIEHAVTVFSYRLSDVIRVEFCSQIMCKQSCVSCVTHPLNFFIIKDCCKRLSGWLIVPLIVTVYVSSCISFCIHLYNQTDAFSS